MDPYRQIRDFIAGLGPDCWYAEYKCPSREMGMEAAGKVVDRIPQIVQLVRSDRARIGVCQFADYPVLMIGGTFTDGLMAEAHEIVISSGGEFLQAAVPPSSRILISKFGVKELEGRLEDVADDLVAPPPPPTGRPRGWLDADRSWDEIVGTAEAERAELLAKLKPGHWYLEYRFQNKKQGDDAEFLLLERLERFARRRNARGLDSGTSSAGVSWWSVDDRTLLTIAGRVLMAAGGFNPGERATIARAVREVGGEFSQATPPGGELVDSEAALEEAEKDLVEAPVSRPWWKIWA